MAAQISVADLTAIGNSTRDGFTGHEMLDGVGLIHMNGRVYDPAVGRFLSVDPLVREAAASQSWNGYGYVEGRVLSAIDPNGYSLAGLSVRGFIRWIEGRASGSTSGGAGASGGGALETVVVEATRLYPPPWVSFDSGMRNGRGSTEGGGSGGSGAGAAGGLQREDSKKQCGEGAVAIGNSLADISNDLGDIGTAFIVGGLTTSGYGALSGQPTVTLVGLGVTVVGGAAGLGSAAFQIGAGIAQSIGGADNSNVVNGAVTLVGSWAVGRWIGGAAPVNPQSASQRALAAQMNATATNVGGLFDLAQLGIPSLDAQQAECPTGP